MGDELETDKPEDYVAPDLAKNPRNIALEEIAKTVATQHAADAAETLPSIDEDGNITPPPADAGAVPAEPAPPPEAAPAVEAAPTPEQPPAVQPPAEPLIIDSTKQYKVPIDGQEVEVPGQKLIDAGFRTFQKETAADYRLQIASKLLQEAEAKVRAATPTKDATPEPAPQTGPTDADLAKALQFGTPEQAADALKSLRERGSVSPEQVARFTDDVSRRAARDEFQFQEALSFVRSEYSDLLANDYLKRLFFSEEGRRRASKEQGGEGDVRPYRDLYKDIGDDLRKAFKMSKPVAAPSPSPTPAAGTAAARAAAKAEVPPVPRTAASRLAATEAVAKVKTPSEIIADMAARRGSNRLNNTMRKET